MTDESYNMSRKRNRITKGRKDEKKERRGKKRTRKRWRGTE